MKLTDLEPVWTAEKGRFGQGISFRCPVHAEGCMVGVFFANPLDGGPPYDDNSPKWWRSGRDFDSLTLTPSIHIKTQDDKTHWHGFVRNGEVT